MIHTVFVLSGEGDDARLVATQIKTGISDGLNTEVLSGLNEGDRVVTGTVSAEPASASAGGFNSRGFPRMR